MNKWMETIAVPQEQKQCKTLQERENEHHNSSTWPAHSMSVLYLMQLSSFLHLCYKQKRGNYNMHIGIEHMHDYIFNIMINNWTNI